MFPCNAESNALVRAEEEIARVEEEICQRTSLLPSLRTARNSHLPVFRIPPEILAVIFVHGARTNHEESSLVHSNSLPSWVNVSYVCHHWRNTALNCPTLWTYHFTVSLHWTKELLFRSKQAPLKISCIYPSSKPQEGCWWPHLVDSLFKHPEHIQKLRLHVPPRLLPKGPLLCAPYLESLEILLIRKPTTESLQIAGGNTHSLRTLKLTFCPLPWHTLNLNNLNILSLHHVPFQFNMPEFLSVLNDMQNLVVLQLEHALPSARALLSSGGLSAFPKIDLLRLTLLEIIAPLSTVIALLSCVNIPSDLTQLSLQLLFEPGASPGDYTLIPLLLAQRYSVSDPRFRSLSIDANRDAQTLIFTTLRDLRLPAKELAKQLDTRQVLQITLEGDDDEMEEMTRIDRQSITTDICCSVPLTNVETLHITWPSNLRNDTWAAILRRLDGLRCMKLTEGFLPDLSMLSLTTRKEDLDGQHQGDHIFVPQLEELVLRYIRFIPDHMLCPGRMSQKTLFDTLSTREGLRGRIKMIECKVR